MTPRQAGDAFAKIIPWLGLFAAGVMGWSNIRRDVDDIKAGAVQAPRFVAESLRVNTRLEAILRTSETNADRLKDICVAVRAGCR